jgi:hypothetical protein
MSFQSYLEGLGYHQEGLKNVGDEPKTMIIMGMVVLTVRQWGTTMAFQVGRPLSNGNRAGSIRNIAVEDDFNVFVDGNNNYQGVGDYNSLYSSRPDLAQQYNASLFEGGEGAANAARIRQETDQQRILFEQQQQAARQAARAPRKSTAVSRWKYYGVNAISTTTTAGSTAASTAARVVGWWTTQTGVCG